VRVVSHQIEAISTHRKIGHSASIRRMLIAEAKPIVYHTAPPVMIPSLKSNLKFHPLMANIILLHILIGN
jgi:hypothetical protein